MITIIVLIVLSITIGLLWIIYNNKINSANNELEEMLDRYSKEREKRLKDTGLIE